MIRVPVTLQVTIAKQVVAIRAATMALHLSRRIRILLENHPAPVYSLPG